MNISLMFLNISICFWIFHLCLWIFQHVYEYFNKFMNISISLRIFQYVFVFHHVSLFFGTRPVPCVTYLFATSVYMPDKSHPIPASLIQHLIMHTRSPWSEPNPNFQLVEGVSWWQGVETIYYEEKPSRCSV